MDSRRKLTETTRRRENVFSGLLLQPKQKNEPGRRRSLSPLTYQSDAHRLAHQFWGNSLYGTPDDSN